MIFGTTYAFAAAVQPGPLQTYIISQTMKKGWRSTIPAAFAPVLSDLPIVAVVLLLLRTMPSGYIAFLRIIGGVFLIYLAYRAFRSWRKFETDLTSEDRPGQQTLFGAVLVNLLNPNPYLGWSLVLGPLVIEGWKVNPLNGISLIVSFYLTMTVTLAGIIGLSGFAGRLGPNVRKSLIGISSVVLFIFGIYQLYLGGRSIFGY